MKHYTFYPDSHRVTVKQFDIQTETKGDIKLQMLSPQEQEILQSMYTFGKLIAMGPTAFKYDRWGNPREDKYEVGDTVYFKQHPGPLHQSQTDHLGFPQGDRIYTINDLDILGHVDIVEDAE